MSVKLIREGILKYGICLLVFVLPLVVFPNFFFYYVSSKTFVFYGFVSILFPLWLYTIYADASYRINKKQLIFFMPLLLYVLWMSLAGVLAVNPHISFWSTFERGTGLITLYAATIISIIVASLVKKDGTSYLHLLIKSLLLGSFILSLTVWVSERGINLPYKIFEYSKGGGLIGNSATASSVLIFAIFLGIYLLFSKDVKKICKTIVSVILITIISSPAFLNIYSIFSDAKSTVEFSKGALVGIVGGVAAMILGYLILSNKKVVKFIGIVGVFISLIIFSVCWVKLVTPGTYFHEKFIQISLNTRFINWDIAQESIKEHPFFGYGPENYYIAYNSKFNSEALRDPYYNEAINDKAHNIYFDTGVSGGYPAILLYIFLIFSIFYVIYIAYRKNKITRLQAVSLVGLIIAYVAQNLFLFDSIVSICYFLLVIGIIYGLFNDADESKSIDDLKIRKINTKRSNIIVGILLVFLNIFLFTFFVFFPSYKAIAFQSIMSSPLLDKTSLYQNLLVGSSMGNDKDASTLADFIYDNYTSGILNNSYSKEDEMAFENDVKSFFNYLEKVSEINKTDLRLQIALMRFNGIYYFMLGKEVTDNSVIIAEEAHRLSPTNPEVYWLMAQIYYYRKDFDKVIESYKNGIAINKTLPASHIIFIRYAKDINNIKLYNEALNQARIDIPQFNFQ